MHPETGATIWETDLGEMLLFYRMVINEAVIVLATDTSLHCCQYDTGARLWSVPIPKPGRTPGLLVENGRVYVLTREGVLGFDGYGRKLFHRAGPTSHRGGTIGFKGNVSWCPFET